MNNVGEKYGHMIGDKFGILKCTGLSCKDKNGSFRLTFDCACGKKDYLGCASRVVSGKVKSCGCKKGSMKHGFAAGPAKEYSAYMSMVKRCYNPQDKYYDYYGGRGIVVCERWLGVSHEEAQHLPYKDLCKKMGEARRGLRNFMLDMGESPKGLTLDKINNDENYSPENCRWATRGVQQINRRKFKRGFNKYIGVSYNAERKKWVAACRADNVSRSKRFLAEKEALDYRNKLAIEMHGEYAFIQEWSGPTLTENVGLKKGIM